MLKKTLIFCAGFFLPFLAGEAYLQWVDPYHFGEKEDWSQYGRAILDKSNGRLRKGASATYLGRTTVISEKGWRSPEFAVEKPADVFRIVMLGGSVPYGWGVEQGDEIPRVLERRLNEQGYAGDKRVEVINCGIPGWKLPEELRLLEKEVPAWHPDMVIVFLVSTDAPAQRGKPPGRSFLLTDPVRRVRLLRALENRYVFNSPGSVGKNYDSYADLPKAGLDLVDLALGLFADECRKIGAQFVLVDTLGVDQTKSRCAELGVHRIDGYTRWELRKSWEVAVTDAHPNAAGHRYFAELIRRKLPPR